MLSLILSSVLFLGQFSAAAQIMEKAVPAASPTASVVTVTNEKTGNVSNTDGKATLVQLARGEKKMTVQDLMEPNFWADTLRELIITIVTFIPRILVAIFLFLVFWFFYRGIHRVILGSMNKAHVDPSIRDMLANLIKWAIMGFGLVIAGNQVGIQITALLTGVSIIGLAIGFAAQETLANFIAGVVIFWDKPFRIGDWIEINNTYGQVQRVSFRSTRLLNGAGEVIVFPNTFILSNRLANHSTHPASWVGVPISIGYQESIDEARQILLSLIAGDTRISKEPAPSVSVRECAESSVNLMLGFWIADQSIKGGMKSEYLEKAKKALDAAGMQIPFPHMQVLIEDTPKLLTGH